MGIDNGRVQDRELYSQILGVKEPWRVESVELKLEQGEVHVHLAHDPERQWPCAECGKLCALYDHQPERRWRHLDTCQFQTILHATPPRSDCPEHGPRTVKLRGQNPEAVLRLYSRDWRLTGCWPPVRKRWPINC